MKTITTIAVIFALLLPLGSPAFSHCEIPCGIYDDQARITLIAEHITTIEKSMNQILELSKEEKPNHNQIVRWVTNKENHATELQHIVSQYFMTQRLRVTDPKQAKAVGEYVKKLTLLHKMLVTAMKAKQTTDLAHVEELRSLLDEFKTAYYGKHTH